MCFVPIFRTIVLSKRNNQKEHKMLKFVITVKGADDLIEDQFDAFIESNEICTVQPACHNMVDYWELEIIPEHDEDKIEFMQLCSEMVQHFVNLGYEF